MEYIYRSLRPGGLSVFWEYNPSQAKRLLREAGFAIVRTDFLFYLPRALRALRPLESALQRLPLGGQFQVLCRKPAS
jgi:ABC-type transport system substrate-binding protein